MCTPNTEIMDSAMRKLYWDPHNLLQVTSDEDGHADIECVGGAQRAHGSRCRWSVPDSETAHRLLVELASMMPGEVSASNLDPLAAVCLCQDHLDQRHRIVERWVSVVKRAAEQYEYVRKSAVKEQDEKLIADFHMLRAGGELTLGESSQFIQVMKDAMSTFDTEKTSLQRELQTSKMTIELLRGSNDILKSDVASLHTENNGFREKVESLLRENKELDSIVDQFRSASNETDYLRNEIQRVSGEIELQNQSLQQIHVKLQQERDLGLTLKDEVTAMEQKIRSLRWNRR